MLGPSDGPLPPPRQKGSGSGVERVTTIVAPPPLFAPLALSGLVVANRVVVAPLSPGRAQDGLPDEAYLAQLGTAARGGAGLVMTAPVAVSREGRITPGCAGMYRAEHVAAWARIVDAVHACAPAKIAIELNHAGRRGATRPRSQGLDRPLRVGGWPLVSASPLPYTPQSPVPQELDRAGMDRVRDDFVHATQMACEAGFDILQLHFAHGYLLASFISPLTNVRNDAYGNETDSSSLMNVPFSTRISTVGPSGPAQYSGPLGPRSEYQPAANVRPDDAPLANRMRFPLEVFDAVRAEWPADRPIMVAITASDCVPGRSWERAERERSGGRGMPRDVADAVAVARLLAAHGCDLITVLAGQTTPDAEPPYGRGFLIPLSDQIRNEAGVATLAGGYITTTNEVNTALAAGHADLCLIEGP
jgi:anthraniloyl-CoA monooxygenase